jgi:hypothetical protein
VEDDCSLTTKKTEEPGCPCRALCVYRLSTIDALIPTFRACHRNLRVVPSTRLVSSGEVERDAGQPLPACPPALPANCRMTLGMTGWLATMKAS